MVRHFLFVFFDNCFSGGGGGLVVSALGNGLSGLGSSPGQGHYVVFLGKRLYLHSAFFHLGVQMGTNKFNAWG